MNSRIVWIAAVAIAMASVPFAGCRKQKTVKSPSAEKPPPPPPSPPPPQGDPGTGATHSTASPPVVRPATGGSPGKPAPARDPDRACSTDQDCVFVPRSPCSCPPCGRVVRTAFNLQALGRWRSAWAARRCAMPACARCPHARVVYVGNKAVCVKGQCTVR